MRRLVVLAVSLFCVQATLGLAQTQLYRAIPTSVGLTLNPPGAAATLSLRSPAYPPSVRLLSTVGLERNLTPIGVLYGSLRYELDGAAIKNTAT